MEAGTSEAILELSKHNHHSRYMLVSIFSKDTDYLASLKVIRGLTEAPILIIKNKYDGTEKIRAVEAGADEYICWPDSIGECVASGRALIRRFQMSEQGQSLKILSCGDLLLCVEYHRAFVCGKEAGLTRQEFDFLHLLLNGAGRVYTHDQICGHIWNDESETHGNNALWNLVSRLRSKIAGMGGDDKILQTVRDVGYRIELVKTA